MNFRIRMAPMGVALAAIGAVGILAANSSAALLGSWSFETSIPATAGPHAAETLGAGVTSANATGLHAGVSTYSSPAGNGSAHSFSSNTWAVGDYYQFVVTTPAAVAYPSLKITLDQTSSGTGPRDFDVQFSTDGSTFASIGTYAVLPNAAPNPTWNTTTSSPIYTSSLTKSAVSSASLYFRLIDNSTTSAGGGTVAAGGTSRVDNVIIESVPEPATAMLLVGGILGAAVARRRAG